MRARRLPEGLHVATTSTSPPALQQAPRSGTTKRAVAVTIAGQRLSLKSDADEGYVQLLADYVDEKIKELGPRTAQVASHEVAVLAALRIADDLFRERRGRVELRRRVRAEVKRMLGSLPGSVETLPGGSREIESAAGIAGVADAAEVAGSEGSKA